MFYLRHIEDLAEDMAGVGNAKKYLAKLAIPVVEGYYDQGAVDAIEAEPETTNIGKKAKLAWTLAETDGVGAMKHVLDRVNLDLVRHLHRRVSYVTVRNKAGKRRSAKVHTSSYMGTRSGRALFRLTGFLDPLSPSHYMLLCYDGPIAWAIKKTEAKTLYEEAKKKKGTVATLPSKQPPYGTMLVRLSAEDSQWLLTSPRRFDL